MIRGTCKQAVTDLCNKYPFMKPVYGYVKYQLNGKQITDGHWWAIDNEGYIADPTRSQLPAKEIEYVYDSRPVLFKCANCGKPVLEDDRLSYFCSKQCAAETIRYLGSVSAGSI